MYTFFGVAFSCSFYFFFPLLHFFFLIEYGGEGWEGGGEEWGEEGVNGVWGGGEDERMEKEGGWGEKGVEGERNGEKYYLGGFDNP